jgi:hypothetical protein
MRRFIELPVEFRGVTGKGFVVLADDVFGFGLSGCGIAVKPALRAKPLYGCEITRAWWNVAHIDRCAAVSVETALERWYIDVLHGDIVLKAQGCCPASCLAERTPDWF